MRAKLLLVLASVTFSSPVAAQQTTEVRITVGDIELAGTLTLPATPGPHPAVVLISGGAANNRDAQVGQFRPFLLLADHLAQEGVASVRFDDRGVDESGGKHFWQYTLPDFVADVDAWVATLKKRPDIDPIRIGLVGHSYGGVIARHTAASNADVAYIVLMASYARSWGDSLSVAARAYGETSQERDEWTAFELGVVNEAVRGNQTWDVVRASLRERASREFSALTAEERARFEELEQFYKTRPYTAGLDYWPTPFYAFLIEDDLRDVMPTVKAPVLMLFGQSDNWVPPTVNRDEMVRSFAAGGNTSVSVIEIPMADHYLRSDPTANEFGAGVLEGISGWILETVNRR